jgi:multidrug efflux pump
LGWFFRPFNRFFEWSSNKYSAGVQRLVRRGSIALIVYGGLVFLTWTTFKSVPAGFVPAQDKQYLVAFAQLPEGASLERTDEIVRKMGEIMLKHPGVQDSIAFPGLSINGFTNSPNSGIAFVGLKPFEERKGPGMSGKEIAAQLQAEFGQIQGAFVAVFPPPPVNGLGTTGGFKLYIEDRNGAGYDELYAATQALLAKTNQTPGLAGMFSGFTVNTPQLLADVDRSKAKQQGIPLGNIFEAMQVNLGSLYVNDFNRFGRTYQVVAQADAEYRTRAEDVARLRTRNDKGQMVPLGSVLNVKETYGPDRAMRYNGYPAADLQGGPALGFSSGQAEALMEKVAAETLPKGMTLDWTDLTYQKILAGNTGMLVFPISILLVFLVLAAQYESFRLPFAVLLIVPMALLSAMVGVRLTDGDNNIFTQIGLIVLIGLAAKNAILIVEFAVHLREQGKGVVESAVEAARLRLRPILMTSIAFIAGVYPLVAATGAGAEMRHAMGVAVFAGMIGVTVFGLLLTPVFYVVLEKVGAKKQAVVPAIEA